MTARGCTVHQQRSPREISQSASRQRVEPELQEEDGRIDRSEVRDIPWDPLALKGRCGVWNSRRGKPSWPAVRPGRINRPDIWMQAIRSNRKNFLLLGGRPHMGPGVRR